MSYWYTKGELSDSIPVNDRGAQYGDGLFETIAIRDAKPRLWDFHVERLSLGCSRLGLHVPDEHLLRSELQDALDHRQIDTHRAVAKIVVSAVSESRGYQRAESWPLLIRVGLFASEELSPDLYRNGIATRLCQTRIALQPSLAGIKSLNRLEQVLARSEWHDPSVFEGLMLDTDNRLICGTMSNVFLCNGNSVLTPAITRCGVSGVMRRQILAALTQAERPFEVRDIEATELKLADEVFVSNSQFGVLPVRRVDSTRYTPGPVTKNVMQLLVQDGITECSL